MTKKIDTVLLDVDGTLIDSTYHHAVAWARAFDSEGVNPPLWQIHRAIGMGGDRLVEQVTDEATERRCGDRLREGWERAYEDIVDDVRAFEGAREFIRSLRARGLKVALASSSKEKFTEKAISLMGASREDFDAITTSDDADASKPDPEILQAALDACGGRNALVIGDSTWDMEAATKMGSRAIGVRTGGFSQAELTDAGAHLVVDAIGDLLQRDLGEVIDD